MSVSTTRCMPNNLATMLCVVYSLLIYQTPRMCTVRLFVKQPLYLPAEHSRRLHSSHCKL